MLGQMTPEQFTERLAHYQVDPWGDEWAAAATIASEITSQTQTYFAAKTGTPTPERLYPKVFDYIPAPKWLRDRYQRAHDRERIAKKAKSNGSHRHHRR